MNVYFTSDLHLGHNAIVKYRTDFQSSRDHCEFWLEKLSQLTKKHILFILGDFLFDCDDYDYLIAQIGKMSTTFKLIMGNHDSRRLYDNDRPTNIELLNPLVTYKKLWLSHCPIHDQEMRDRLGNVHGHLHKYTIDDKRYFNVCPEQHDYNFVSLDDIKIYYEIFNLHQ